MIDLKVTVIGDKEIAAKLADASSGIRDVLRDELAQIGDEIVSRAQAAAPVRTVVGGLRSRIVWYFGREMKRGPRGAKRLTPVDVKWKDSRIEMTTRPRGRVAHLVERGVNATFMQRPGRGGNRVARDTGNPGAGEGPVYRYQRTLKIRRRPFFMPAVESVGGSAGVNARLQARLERLAASMNGTP